MFNSYIIYRPGKRKRHPALMQVLQPFLIHPHRQIHQTV